MPDPVLSLRDLTVGFKTPNGMVQAVRGIDLDVAPGEAVGVVGESGSGKSVSFLATLGLLPSKAVVTGSAKVAGIELVGASRRTLDSVRGKKAAMNASCATSSAASPDTLRRARTRWPNSRR